MSRSFATVPSRCCQLANATARCSAVYQNSSRKPGARLANATNENSRTRRCGCARLQYRGAGTVEFLVDAHDQTRGISFFLEVCRIQVDIP